MLFLDLDVEHHPIRRRAVVGRNLHRFERRQLLQAPLGGVDQTAIIGVALGNVELAPDHLVARERIAVNVDSLDIAAWAVVKREDDVDDIGRGIAIGVRADIGEWKSAFAGCHRNGIDCLADSLAVKQIALSEVHDIAQGGAIERRNTRLDFNRAEPIARAFVDGDRTRQRPRHARRRIHSSRRSDATDRYRSPCGQDRRRRWS